MASDLADRLEAMGSEFHSLNSALANEDYATATVHLETLGYLGLSDPRYLASEIRRLRTRVDAEDVPTRPEELRPRLRSLVGGMDYMDDAAILTKLAALLDALTTDIRDESHEWSAEKVEAIRDALTDPVPEVAEEARVEIDPDDDPTAESVADQSPPTEASSEPEATRVDAGYDWRCGCEPWSPDPTCPTHGAPATEQPESEGAISRVEMGATEYVEVRWEEGIRVMEVGCVDGGYRSAVDVPDYALPLITAALRAASPATSSTKVGYPLD